MCDEKTYICCFFLAVNRETGKNFAGDARDRIYRRGSGFTPREKMSGVAYETVQSYRMSFLEGFSRVP